MSKTRNPDALIRIEDAIKVLCRETCYPGLLCPDSYCVEMWDEFEDVERIDAVPVVHGRWIEDPDDDWGYRCSECGHLELYQFDYCSSCGARMDGKDGDND